MKRTATTIAIILVTASLALAAALPGSFVRNPYTGQLDYYDTSSAATATYAITAGTGSNALLLTGISPTSTPTGTKIPISAADGTLNAWISVHTVTCYPYSNPTRSVNVTYRNTTGYNMTWTASAYGANSENLITYVSPTTPAATQPIRVDVLTGTPAAMTRLVPNNWYYQFVVQPTPPYTLMSWDECW